MAATSGTCTDVYTLNSALTGTTSINLGNVTVSWNDNSGTYNNQAIQGSTVYANLSVRPAITITPVTTTWNTMMGSAYAFTATISGGSSTVTPTVTGLTGNTLSPASCALNDAAQPPTTSCTFIITPYTGIGNYSFWNPASVANSTNVNTPSNAYTPVTNISLQVSAGNGATINGNPSPQTFSNITGTVIAPYVYLPQTGQTPTAPLDVTATTGADGNVHVGIPWAVAPSGGSTAPNPHFTDDGCEITDNLTNLVWVKDLNTVNSGESLSWENALNIAESGIWCNHTDWRVPNINELASLINYSEVNLADWLNTPIASGGAGFSNVKNITNSAYYWSSSSEANDPTRKTWMVNMSNGMISTRNKSGNGSSNLLFPVRGGQ